MITEWNHRENLHVDPLWDLSSLVSQQLLCSLSINQWFYKRPNRTYTIKKSVKFFLNQSITSLRWLVVKQKHTFLKLTYTRRFTCLLVQLNGKKVTLQVINSFWSMFLTFYFCFDFEGKRKTSHSSSLKLENDTKDKVINTFSLSLFF